MSRPGKPLFDVQAPVAEQLLEPLIAKFGLSKVLEDLAKLYPRTNHECYMRVSALANNVNNKLKRKQ